MKLKIYMRKIIIKSIINSIAQLYKFDWNSAVTTEGCKKSKIIRKILGHVTP
jgi:hypothetical protein